MEERRSAFKILTGVPLGRPRRRWEGYVRVDLKEIRGTGLIRLWIEVIGTSIFRKPWS